MQVFTQLGQTPPLVRCQRVHHKAYFLMERWAFARLLVAHDQVLDGVGRWGWRERAE